jgi:Family of unknown function (DUF6644)
MPLMSNTIFLDFANWLAATRWSTSLHESLYLYSWLESSHVLALILSLGLLFIIDLRMLGLIFKRVPASDIAARLHKPMIAAFIYMFISGILLYIAIPVRTTHSIWFRTKMVLLLAAGINAWLFNRHLTRSHATWDLAAVPPRSTRFAAGLSLALWTGIVICGRFIAYDWYDCDRPIPVFISWFEQCSVK